MRAPIRALASKPRPGRAPRKRPTAGLCSPPRRGTPPTTWPRPRDASSPPRAVGPLPNRAGIRLYKAGAGWQRAAPPSGPRYG
eukprot:1371018-Prymnesium_polylepis.1